MSIAKLAEGQAHLSQVCNRLGVAIEAVRAREPLAPLDTVNPEDAQEAFTTLVYTVLAQQLSTRVASVIKERLQTTCGGLQPQTVLTAGEDKLRSAGLSGAKTRCILGLAQAELAGELSFSQIAGLDDDEATLQLCKFKGVGPWTAQNFLLFGLGRWDLWPVADLGLQEAVRRLYQLEQRPDTVQMQEIAQDWRPWRSIAARVLWRWRDSQA